MKRLILILITLAAVSVSACGEKWKDENNNPRKNLNLSTKATEFVGKGNDFALEFINRVDKAEKEDYIISPLSMQFLLGMILNGARGETADEICDVLGYGAGETDDVNDFCLAMMKQLPDLDKKTKLSIANAIVVDDGWPLLESYKTDVASYYNAEVSNLDFSDTQGSARAINKWCSDHTNGMIPKILDEVDPNMLAYLLNAMYFKSNWSNKFDKNATSKEDFTTETGTKKKVETMKQNRSLKYTENDVWQAVVLPYGNGAFSMTVLLPRKGYGTGDVIAALGKTGWSNFTRSFTGCEVDLWLPKFETTFHIKLNDILTDMGMPSSFDSKRADFKAMSDYALCLSFVQQDAKIIVDEEGTEAAVVSSAGMEKATAIMPGQQVVFHADHTFIYLISEASSGAILFAGRYGK